ncbi:VOC family protein [Marinactinospora thermotolerans]|uniref:VOC family protein n=1 Tax=Marinactinospora thermotolerans TaxID=531310 RepID=UPI001F3B4642|nr:VOC family protein [Marinactinospora thermotolerans]
MTSPTWPPGPAGPGGEVISEPGHRPWGYAVTLADPDGHVWQITAASPAAS